MSIFTKVKSWEELLNYSILTDITQVGERAKERLNFLGIQQETLDHVREASEYLIPHKEEMIEHFYNSIQSAEHLHQIIKKYSTVERLKTTFGIYLDQFFQAEVNDEYIKTRIKIGQTHSRIHLMVDHFISAHHVLTQIMTSILMEKLHHKPNRMMKLVLAIQKLATYDQQLIVEVYMEETFKQFLFNISDLLNQMTSLNMTEQLIKGMDKQIEETHSVTAATEEMGASIQEVANYSQKVAEGTDEAVQSAEQSKQVVDEALGNIKQVGNVYEQVVKKVGQLEKEIEHTQNVVKIIKEIADQTNLLALNASIEAARAGEHGKGFSVVASEVRKLSEHTKEQIIQITSNMESLQNVSNQVTQQIKQTGKLVEQSVNGAIYAGEALTSIVTTMKDINRSTSQIAAMSEEQTATVLDIAERNNTIYDLSVHSQDISKDAAKTIFELSKKLEDYRNTFFDVNVKFSSKDLIYVAKTDHLLWKWKVYNMILGLEDINSEEVISHEVCRLGKWYYGDLPDIVKNSDAFKRLEEPHKEVHQYAKKAVECYEAGDIAGAQHAFEQLEKASDSVLDLLTQLESKLST